ncbi:hypothetical protein ACJRO7_018254 [Eucalyptus globulus]|uniref:RING-type E3 ubiquitin transferase n=1 Tax=Eucalyptus globulus TaxID=34317 RepID=A0ABD3KU77_EUCGL
MASNMPILSLFSAFFFFFLLLDHLVSPLPETCPEQFCEVGDPIRFPFRLKQSQPNERCAYPGFDLICNAQRQTTLNLPISGEFIVETIEYTQQVIMLRDHPEGCLLKRLQDFTLSGSNWTVQHNIELTLFKCPKTSWYPGMPQLVPCLDGQNYSVVAVTSDELPQQRRRLSSIGCSDNGTVTVPTVDSANPLFDDALRYPYAFLLAWTVPSCGSCGAGFGTCGFKGKKGLEITCTVDHGSPDRRADHRWIFVAISIPCFIYIVCLFSQLSRKFRARRQAQQDQTDGLSPTDRAQALVVISGMDTSTIESYPKTRIGDNGAPMPQENTCSICLSEYKPEDVLRTIPACEHSFHAHCIDPWLKRNAICPLCRAPQGYVTNHNFSV